MYWECSIWPPLLRTLLSVGAGYQDDSENEDEERADLRRNAAYARVGRGEAPGVSPSLQLRWRWIMRAIHITMFEPYMVPLLSGTWLWNVWLRCMGADVSMGALIFDHVYDFDFLKVCTPCAWGGCWCVESRQVQGEACRGILRPTKRDETRCQGYSNNCCQLWDCGHM